MATPRPVLDLTDGDVTAEERSTLEPFAEQVMEIIRRADPGATYTFAPPIDPGIWIMHAYVRPELLEDEALEEALADAMADLMIHHNVGLAPLLRRREHTSPAT